MLEISEVQEVEKTEEPQENQYGLYYTIEALYYGCGRNHNEEPHICLKLTEIGFPKNNSSHVFYLDNRGIHYGDGDEILLCLNKKTFSHLTGYWWDGTEAGLEPLKKLLTKRKFGIGLNIT